MILSIQTITQKSGGDIFTLVGMGDFHTENVACDRAHLAQDIGWIRDNPNAYWLGMGDHSEWILTDDPRYDPELIEDRFWPAMQKQRDPDFALAKALEDDLYEMLHPIRGRCLGLHYGNHWDNGNTNCPARKGYPNHADLCGRLGVRNLHFTAMTRLVFRRGKHTSTFRIFSTHGRGNGASPGYVLNRLQVYMNSWDADIYLTGHHHRLVSEKKTRLSITRKGRAQERKHSVIGVGCGGYFKGYKEDITTYVEKHGYPPTDIGCAKIHITPETGEIRVEV